MSKFQSSRQSPALCVFVRFCEFLASGFACLVFCLLILKLLNVDFSDTLFLPLSTVLFGLPFLLEKIKENFFLHILHLGPPTLLSELVTEPGIQWPGFVS